MARALAALLLVLVPLAARDDWERAAALEGQDPLGAARAAVQALVADAGVPSPGHQGLAFRIGTALAESGELEAAAELQVTLHGRVGADWSAINAAITLGRLGRLREAEELLAAHEPRAEDRGAIANYRGLTAKGAGDLGSARVHFARALAAGSRDAGLSLARLDLLAGDASRARAGFRPGVDDPSPHAWALRGWALTLLP